MTTIRSRIVSSLTELLQSASSFGWVVDERAWRETFNDGGKVAFVFHVGEDKRLETGGPEARVLSTLHLRVAVIFAVGEVPPEQSVGEAMDEAVAALERALPMDDPQTILSPLPVVDLRFPTWTVSRADAEGTISGVLELDCDYRHDADNPSTIEGGVP